MTPMGSLRALGAVYYVSRVASRDRNSVLGKWKQITGGRVRKRLDSLDRDWGRGFGVA